MVAYWDYSMVESLDCWMVGMLDIHWDYGMVEVLDCKKVAYSVVLMDMKRVDEMVVEKGSEKVELSVL